MGLLLDAALRRDVQHPQLSNLHQSLLHSHVQNITVALFIMIKKNVMVKYEKGWWKVLIYWYQVYCF